MEKQRIHTNAPHLPDWYRDCPIGWHGACSYVGTTDPAPLSPLNITVEYEEAKILLSQYSEKDIKKWNVEEAIFSTPIVTELHKQAIGSKTVSETFWKELDNAIRPLMPNFMSVVDSFNLRPSSKGYKLCILTRLEFSLSEICVLLDMSSQSLNIMRRRMNKKLFGGSEEAKLFDENIRSMKR